MDNRTFQILSEMIFFAGLSIIFIRQGLRIKSGKKIIMINEKIALYLSKGSDWERDLRKKVVGAERMALKKKYSFIIGWLSLGWAIITLIKFFFY